MANVTAKDGMRGHLRLGLLSRCRAPRPPLHHSTVPLCCVMMAQAARRRPLTPASLAKEAGRLVASPRVACVSGKRACCRRVAVDGTPLPG